MNAVWLTRWELIKWYATLGAFREWRQRRARRRALLTTPGVDHLVRTVMDMRYGKYGWRVSVDMLEARVVTHGQGVPWWGPIGPLRSINTRKWLTSVWMEHKGIHTPRPATSAPSLDASEPASHGYYDQNYADTEPGEHG